jgi:glycosyltransferase involved in cell wall biosynthesis
MSAYRLHRGLIQLGEDSRMIVRHKLSAEDSVLAVVPANMEGAFGEELFLGNVVQGHYINSHRTKVSNTLFSLPYPGYDLSSSPLVQAADVLNLHWVAYYQSTVSLRKLVDLGKPIVWTLHDQWAFTGGCHVALGCDKYREDCHACPQLADDLFGLPEAVLADKLELLRQADFTVVTPSQWMATCASESRLFKDATVLAIPNSVEPEVFAPLPKARARQALALPLESVVLLFGATNVGEKLKGFRELEDALEHCLADPRFQDLVDNCRITLLCFGHGSEEVRPRRIPVTPLGYVTCTETMRSAYAAADVFVLPSLVDNLPNTMLEAMSCGLPVVAFGAGGIPESVVDGVSGRLAAVGDVRALAEAILSVVFDVDRRKAMGEEARRAVLAKHTPEQQALRYRELYEDLIRKRHSKAARDVWGAESSPQNEAWKTQADDTLAVLLDTGLGPHLQGIYDAVLFKALKEFALAREKAYRESEADRHARLHQITDLTQLLEESEADRAARLEVIGELNQSLEASEADRAARLEQIGELNQLLEGSEADRAARLAKMDQLTLLYQESEADRAARLHNMDELAKLLRESEADRDARLETINRLTQLLQESEADRAARLEIIRTQEARLTRLEADLRALESRVEVRLRRRIAQLLGR